jgi:hypothetical protein
MRPSHRRVAMITAPVVLLTSAIAMAVAFTGSARAGTAVNSAATEATPAATCTGQAAGQSSCTLNQDIQMPVKINIWTDASPEQGQQATVSWTLQCVGTGNGANASGHKTATVPFRTTLGIPQSGGSDCQMNATISLSGGGIVTAGLYPTLGTQVMISLPTGQSAPGAPLAYYKCMTDKFNSSRAGAEVVMGGCGTIFANTWNFDGSHFTHGGLCLTDPSDGGSGTWLRLERCTGKADQAWTYRPQHGTDYDEIAPHSHNNLCVNDNKLSQRNGAPLSLSTCNNGAPQNWTLSD